MTRTSLLIAAAVLLPFANGGDSMVFAAFLAPLVLLRFSRSNRPARGLLSVLVLEAVAFAVQFRGMIPVPAAMLAIIVLFYAVALTIPYVADRLLAPRLSGWSKALVFPCAWAATEYAVSFSPYGSWGSAAYALSANLALIQLLSVTGLWGLTFLIGWTASAGNRVWDLAGEPSPMLRSAGVTVGVVAIVGIGGSIRLTLFPPSAPSVRVASLSRVELPLHFDPKAVSRFYRQKELSSDELAVIREHSATIDDDLLERSAREAASGARIVFWGEANAPVLAEDTPALIRRGAAVAKSAGIYLGMSLAEWHRDSSPPLENKIVLIGPDGAVIWEYLKSHPVPGGEAEMSVVRGGKLLGVDTPFGRVTSVICFDADFPQLLAQAGALRADLVLDPSNDWLAIDPWHTTMASYRAIEQGVNLVRHASLGRSAAFDYQGRLLASMDHFGSTDHVLVSHVPTRGVRTLYAMLGDWFAWASLLGLASLVIRAVAVGRKSLDGAPPSTSADGTMNRRSNLPAFCALFLAILPARLSAQQSAVPAGPTAGDTIGDAIDGTVWLGTIKSPSGATPFGLEFRRTAKGALRLIEYMPVMHLYSQVVSRVTPRDGEYVLEDLPGAAHLEGHTLRGVALYSKMPFELERASKLPESGDPAIPPFPAAPKPRWSRALGAAAWASPVIRGGTIYLGTADGRFHALRASDGAEVWTWADSTPLYGEALVTSDSVFVVTDRTELVRLDRMSGALVWRVPLDTARRFPAALPEDNTFSHRTAVPVMVDGVLYIGSTDGSMLAIDPARGQTKWRINAGAKICAPAAVSGSEVMVGTFDGTLLALSRVDGHELWRRKFADAIVSAPVLHGGMAIVGARDYLMHAVRVSDGSEAWTQDFWASWVESTPRIVDGLMYVGSSDLRVVRAMDPATGAVRWSTDVFGVAWGSPVVTGASVYMGAAGVNGYMIAHHPSLVALDRRTGAIQWRQLNAASSGAPVTGYVGTPAYANHTLYAVDLGGTLVALPIP